MITRISKIMTAVVVFCSCKVPLLILNKSTERISSIIVHDAQLDFSRKFLTGLFILYTDDHGL